MKNNEKIKRSQCLKSFSENETDNCEKCDQQFCSECLTYYGELTFYGKCK